MWSFKRRRAAKEIERKIRFKQGLSRVRAYIDRSSETRDKMWMLGKRSLQMGDAQQFKNIAKGYLKVGEVIGRWERYIVAAETVAVRRDQASTTKQFLQSMSALTETMAVGAKPEDVVAMQQDLEGALMNAQVLEETLDEVMDTADESIFSGQGLSADTLKEVEKAMSMEATVEDGELADSRIDEGLKRVEEAMRRESAR